MLVKPVSHRIVRLLDRTIGCYLANVRLIGNVCYDRQQRSHTAIGLSSLIVRLVVRVVARSTSIRSIVRSIVTPTIDRMINSVGRRMGSDLNPRNISTLYSVSEQPIGGTTGRKVTRPVARLIVRPLTIWNSRFQVLNMTIDIFATDLPLAINHDLCHQSYDLCHQSYDRSTIGPSFQHFSIAGRS